MTSLYTTKKVNVNVSLINMYNNKINQLTYTPGTKFTID